LARTCLRLYEAGACGTYHVCDGGDCSWYQFACEIARHVDQGLKVDPCGSADFPRPARRPQYSILDLAKTEALLGPMPPWRDNLADVMKRLEPL
jgi:dTDP-4-dehydrorhamnose reductase